MWQSQVVLERDIVRDEEIIYRVKEDGAFLDKHTYAMPGDVYDEMGEPATITLAVVVGDRLNP